jgi:prepilin-type N-terminal cleavage/methylation domain-containing protein
MSRRPTALRGERGFTIVELMATMTVMGIVLAVFGQMLVTSSKTSSRIEEQATLQNDVRAAVDRLTTDFRQATNANGTSPVESVSGTALTFDSPDRMTPFHLRRVSYQLSNGQLQRSSTTSTDSDGWPWVWPPGAPSWTSEIGSVTNASVFTFYDASGAITTDATAVRSARISVTAAPRQTQGGSATYTALVTIRTLQ